MLIILNLPTHGHGLSVSYLLSIYHLSLHLSIISILFILNNSFYLPIQKSCTVFIRFIPTYMICFGAFLKMVFYIILFLFVVII